MLLLHIFPRQMKNIIQFRKGFINLPQTKTTDNYSAAMTVMAELMQFGYILDDSAIEHLRKAPLKSITAFHTEVLGWLRKVTGSNRNYRPFWKGFPEEVMEKSEMALWYNQIRHYWSNGRFEPSEWTRLRPSAFENSKYTLVRAGNDADYARIFTDLVSVNQSLTPDDLETIKFFVTNGDPLVFPPVIPFKENLCTLAGMGLAVPVKSVTDVLRIAVHMSGGDISLPAVPPAKVKTNRWSSSKSDNPARSAFRFRKFSRPERKLLMSLLESTNCDIREASLKLERWKRLGEVLHPGDYENSFPRAVEMFDVIRNSRVQSWYGALEAAFRTSFDDGLTVLAERPGEFMRRLDSLVRKANKTQLKKIFATLRATGERASNKVLYEALDHFEKRLVGSPRSIMVKGARKRTTLPDLPALPQETVDGIADAIYGALLAKFSKLEPLGKVWIDEELKKIPLPTNMRSMSTALRPTIRGQRVPIGNQDAKVIRAYVHWFDERGNRDIDLTGTFIGPKGVTHIGWNGRHNDDSLGCYSGDIRHRRGACAEYVDIKVEPALKAGYRYVVIDARNYNGGSLKEIKDCVFGYMEREHAKANEVFVPSTLANSVVLQSDASTTLVAVIDLQTREYIFLDIDADGIPVASANFDAIMKAIKPYTEMPKVSVYHLLHMHAEARGKVVKTEKSADVKFSLGDFSESYVETMKWMGV